MRQRQLLEELFHAILAMGGLVIVVSGLYWLISGEPPFAFAAGGAVGFLFGVIILTISAPARR
jgi:hypothetical protein